MTGQFAERRATFRALHQSGCFIIPNPWDVGSARRLEKLGFKALASSSSAAAWTLGLNDHQITIEQILDHLDRLCAATDLPVNADFESGFADSPEGVAANVKRALGTGIAGLSIEDQAGPGQLYPLDMAVARIRAARAAIDAGGTGALLVARTEAYLNDLKDVSLAVDRLTAFAEAGAARDAVGDLLLGLARSLSNCGRGVEAGSTAVACWQSIHADGVPLGARDN